jgi:chromosome segregation ATPase
LSLLDAFRRPRDRTPDADAQLHRRLGRLEADCESLRLQWTAYRDEIKRLVTRLEKRDQRAEALESRINASEAEGVTGIQLDPTSQRVLERRRRMRGNGISGQS